jgi:hypothetical protein
MIDQAYRGEMPSHIDTALFEAEIFNKIGDRIVLNEAYIRFVNTMLKRVEYGVIFGNYAQELQQLVSYKKRFVETGEKTYLSRMRKGIEDIYLKFKRRDSDINVLIAKIVHENRLSLEVILDDAEDILSQMKELSNASTQTYEIFSKEIAGVGKEIDALIVDVKIDIQRYSENLHKYIHRLNGFILRTKQRKEQNNKIAALAQKIMANEAVEFDALLRSSHETLHHTFGNMKRHKIKTLPASRDLEHERFGVIMKQLFSLQPQKAVKAPPTIYKPLEMEKRVVLNYQKVLEDIKKQKPNDLYAFIIEHDEVKKFENKAQRRSEAFKAFLLTVSEQRVHTDIQDEFESHNIRRVTWR